MGSLFSPAGGKPSRDVLQRAEGVPWPGASTGWSVVCAASGCRFPLAGVVWWTECQPENCKVAGSIPRQGTCLGGGPGPQLGACERQLSMYLLHIDVSLPLLLFPSPSLKK